MVPAPSHVSTTLQGYVKLKSFPKNMRLHYNVYFTLHSRILSLQKDLSSEFTFIAVFLECLR